MDFWDARVFEPFFTKLEHRSDLVNLVRPGGIGVELGVADGHFSSELLSSGRLSHLYSIDMYAGDRGHDIEQYIGAIRALSAYKDKNSLIKMRFNEALQIFIDQYFDFIYVDGYAHTGEEGGRTFFDWLPKLRSGGVFAGHDYSPIFPQVIDNVNRFAAEIGVKVHVINDTSDGWNSGCPSWFIIRP